MSQHFFRTACPKGEVEVVTGWDRPLKGFFLRVEVVQPESEEPQDDVPPIFDNLSLKVSHPKTFDYFQSALNKLGINLPEEMKQEILRDGSENKGNKVVEHKVEDGKYVRELHYEE